MKSISVIGRRVLSGLALIVDRDEYHHRRVANTDLTLIGVAGTSTISGRASNRLPVTGHWTADPDNKVSPSGVH